MVTLCRHNNLFTWYINSCSDNPQSSFTLIHRGLVFIWMFIFDIFMVQQVKCRQGFFKICDLFVFLVVFLLLLSGWSDSVLPSHVESQNYAAVDRKNIYSPCTFQDPWSRLAFRKHSYAHMTAWCFLVMCFCIWFQHEYINLLKCTFSDVFWVP